MDSVDGKEAHDFSGRSTDFVAGLEIGNPFTLEVHENWASLDSWAEILYKPLVSNPTTALITCIILFCILFFMMSG